MNEPQDNHLDPLLDEALSPDEPSAELLARIDDLTDGPVCDLLSEALSAEAVDCNEDELVQNILNATSEQPATIARLHPIGWAWRIAAMVAVVASLFVLIWSLSQQTVTSPTDSLATLEKLEDDFETLPTWETETTGFSQEIALLTVGVDRIAAQNDWADSPDALVEHAAATVDWLDSTASQTPSWF